jgi:hypothetical protein
MKSNTKKIITAHDDVINIDDSDDDVQYMGTTAAPQRACLHQHATTTSGATFHNNT